MRRAKWLILVALLVAVVAVAIPQGQTHEEKIPELATVEIFLAEASLDEINAGPKSTKYEGNVVRILENGETAEYQGVEIKGRGNTTWALDGKRPYQIKFSEKVDLFGMGKARKWVLLANMLDEADMRNDVAFYLEKMMGSAYAVEGRFVNLEVDNEWIGLYYLTEKVEIGKERIDLRDPLGVVAELDNGHSENEEPHYSEVWGAIITMKDLVAEDNHVAATADFMAAYNRFERAVYEKDFAKIAEIIDVESFARYFLLSEFSIDPDAYVTSFYLYKDGVNDKIHAAAGWDYDYGFGNHNWLKGEQPEEYYYPDRVANNRWPAGAMKGLIAMPEFQEVVGRIYREALLGKKAELLNHFWETYDLIAGSARKDAEKWQLEPDFEQEVAYLADWISRKYDYLDDEYGGLKNLQNLVQES